MVVLETDIFERSKKIEREFCYHLCLIYLFVICDPRIQNSLSFFHHPKSPRNPDFECIEVKTVIFSLLKQFSFVLF